MRYFTAIMLFALAGALSVHADAPKIQVQAFDPELDTSAFAAPGYELHQSPRAGTANDDLVSPKTRDTAFSRAGFEAALQTWDAVDRDVLFLRARHLSLAELQGHYPELNREALRKLSQAILKQ